ncbi:MAG: hypothetical protein K8R63_02630 [Bacteroidales bacterium]|nr:hypothetical protein [Bacteroidales bacterium]
MQNNQSIIFLGDSLTEWFELEKYFPGLAIINEGIAGDTTYGVLQRLEDIIKKPAKKIFLMIGINDIFNDFPEENIKENQQLIIEQIITLAAPAELIVQSLLPVNEHMLGIPDKLNHLIRHINKDLQDHCKSNKVQFLDLYTEFLSGDEMNSKYTTDGGHLSEKGYEAWAGLIAPFL